MWTKIQDKITDPTFMLKFHGINVIVLFILSFPVCIFLSNSIPIVVFISMLALVLAELSSWQATRTEVKQIEMEERERRRENSNEV